MDLLREHKVEQTKERLRLGKRWLDTFGLVFTRSYGVPHEGSAVTRRFQEVCDNAGLPHIRFHDLRHSAASFWLAHGVPARVVMEYLGHSTITLTMDTYSHVTPQSLREAANTMQNGLGGPA